MSTVKLALPQVSRRFGTLTALAPTDLEVQQEEFICLVGPSGCGKNTLFNVISGVLTPDSGQVQIDGSRAQRAQGVALARRYGLGEFINHYPAALSGGMRQRVALDAQTRLAMQQWLLQVWSEQRRTVVFITHDIDEAIMLADRNRCARLSLINCTNWRCNNTASPPGHRCTRNSPGLLPTATGWTKISAVGCIRYFIISRCICLTPSGKAFTPQ